MPWFKRFAVLNPSLFAGTVTGFGGATTVRASAGYFVQPLLALVVVSVAGREVSAVFDSPASITGRVFLTSVSTLILVPNSLSDTVTGHVCIVRTTMKLHRARCLGGSGRSVAATATRGYAGESGEYSKNEVAFVYVQHRHIWKGTILEWIQTVNRSADRCNESHCHSGFLCSVFLNPVRTVVNANAVPG